MDIVSIDDIVRYFGLQLGPNQSPASDSYYVSCPFCSSHKFHMNINRRKNAYHSWCESGGGGVLDLYGRLSGIGRLIPGPGGNGKELSRAVRSAILGTEPGAARTVPVQAELQQTEGTRPAPDDALNLAYSALLCFLKLTDAHRENLHKRGLPDDVIDANGYKTLNVGKWALKTNAVKVYDELDLNAEKAKYQLLKDKSKAHICTGIYLASLLVEKGIQVRGVPGFYSLKGQWIFNPTAGMVIPTRNIRGQIVCLQVRKDRGNVRYLTISSKGLPEGVDTDISRIHFPLNNSSTANTAETMLTEGPLKADVASFLYGKPSVFVAVQGVNNVRELPHVMRTLRGQGVEKVYNAFDMDRLCNPNVREASRNIGSIIRDAGLKYVPRYWDAGYASVKEKELVKIYEENALSVPSDWQNKSVFFRVQMMAAELSGRGIPHSFISDENGNRLKDYWSAETKGIDDYLLKFQTEEKKNCSP